MNFLESIQVVAPLQLRPDRPASDHLLSYDQVLLQRASSQLQQQKDKEQLAQIDRLSELIRQKDRQIGEQETKYLERHLLFEIEIDRLRRILSEWDGERRKYQEDTRAKQRIYQSKLEELKSLLSSQFTQRVDQIRAENKQDLQRIKQLYDIRIAKVQEESLKEEHRLRLVEMDADNKYNRLQLSEAERQKLQAAILFKDDKITQMEQQITELQMERRKLRDENERLAEEKGRQLEYLRTQQESKLGEYEAMKVLVNDLQATVEQLRIDKEQYNEARRRAADKISSLQIRCESLQQEVQQFRSRKTQHNAFAREASQNTLTQQLSDRQQLSPLLKDSRSLPKIIKRNPYEGDTLENANTQEKEYQKPEQVRRIMQLEEQVQKMEEEKVVEKRELVMKDQQLAEKDQELRRKDQQLKAMARELQGIKRTLQEKEKQLVRLRSSANDLQGKLSQKQGIIQKLQADLQRKSDQRTINDGGKMEKVWLERLQKSEEALQNLNQEWIKRQRQLAGLFKKIDATYRQQLQKSKQTEESLKKENQELTQVFMEKIKQLSLNK